MAQDAPEHLGNPAIEEALLYLARATRREFDLADPEVLRAFCAASSIVRVWARCQDARAGGAPALGSRSYTSPLAGTSGCPGGLEDGAERGDADLEWSQRRAN